MEDEGQCQGRSRGYVSMILLHSNCFIIYIYKHFFLLLIIIIIPILFYISTFVHDICEREKIPF